MPPTEGPESPVDMSMTLPNGVVVDLKDDTALAAVINSLLPQNISILRNDRARLTLGVSPMDPGRILANFEQLRSRLSGFPPGVRYGILKAFIGHEKGHIAVIEELDLTTEEIKRVYAEMSQVTKDRVLNEYFSSSGASADVVARKIEQLRTEGKLEVVLVHEFLRQEVSRAVYGATDEELAEFYKQPPGVFRLIRQAIRIFIRNLRRQLREQPFSAETAAMISRGTRRLRKMEDSIKAMNRAEYVARQSRATQITAPDNETQIDQGTSTVPTETEVELEPEESERRGYTIKRRGSGAGAGIIVRNSGSVVSLRLAPPTVAEINGARTLASIPGTDLHLIDSAEVFAAALAAGAKTNERGEQVTVKAADEYAGAMMFLSPDGYYGFAIQPDGDAGSLFAHGENKKTGSRRLLSLFRAFPKMIMEGSRVKADSYATALPRSYTANGFRPVSRIPWNDEYKPENWDYEKYRMYQDGRPDMIFYVYEPGFSMRWDKDTSRLEFPIFDTWEEADAERQRFVDAISPPPEAAEQAAEQIPNPERIANEGSDADLLDLGEFDLAEYVMEHDMDRLIRLLEGQTDETEDRGFLQLPVLASSSGKLDSMWDRLKRLMYNMPYELRALVNERDGAITWVSSVLKDFVRDYPKLRAKAVEGGVAPADLDILLGTTAPVLTSAEYVGLEYLADQYRQRLPKNMNPSTANRMTQNELVRLTKLARLQRLQTFRKDQQEAEVRVRGAGFGKLADKVTMFRKEIDLLQMGTGFNETIGFYLTRAYRYFNTVGWSEAAKINAVVNVDGVDYDFSLLRRNAAALYEQDAKDELDAEHGVGNNARKLLFHLRR
jgi:hypothetical protein